MSVRSQKEKSVLPKEVEHWSLTALREKLVKIGAKVVRHGRYVTFQLAVATKTRTGVGRGNRRRGESDRRSVSG